MTVQKEAVCATIPAVREPKTEMLVYFATLQKRLIGSVRRRIQDGQLTERTLARLAGISQPHLHNILKGVRRLSPEIGDRILGALKLSVLDLLDTHETLDISPGQADPDRYIHIPVLEGLIGPGLPLPTLESRVERHLCRSDFLAQVVEPRFARLAPDERMRPLLAANDIVLLDQSKDKRTYLEPDGLYLVNRQGQGAIRKLRAGARCLYLLTAEDDEPPETWEKVPLKGSSPLEIVLAKVVSIVRLLESGAPSERAPGDHQPVGGNVLLEQARALGKRAGLLLAAAHATSVAQSQNGDKPNRREDPAAGSSQERGQRFDSPDPEQDNRSRSF